MKKRIFSILLTMVMLIGLLPVMSVSAAVDKKLDNFLNAYNVYVDGTTVKAEICTDEENVYAGSNSLQMVHRGDDDASTSEQACVRSAVLGDTQVNYTLEFYAKFVSGDISALRFGFFNYSTEIKDEHKVGEPTADGWQKYSYTAKDASNGRFTLYTLSDVEVYFDNFKLICVDSTHANYNVDVFAATGGIGEVATERTSGDGGNEDEEEEVVVGTKVSNPPTGWSDTSKATNMLSATSYTIEVSTAEKYQGSNSLHIKFDPADEEANNASVAYTAKNIANTNQNYTLTFYAKGSFTKLQTNFFSWSAVDLSSLEGVDAGNGWKKYTYKGLDSGGSDKLTLYTATNVAVDVYLDNITLVNEVTGEDLLESNGGIAELIVTEPEQGGNDDEEDEIAAFEPDVTGKALSGNWIFDTESKVGGVSNILEGTEYSTMYSAQEIYEGNRAMHIQFKAPSYDIARNISVKSLATTYTNDSTEYTVTFYTKGSTTGTYIQFFTYNSNVDLTKTAAFDEVTYDSATGWTKYVITEKKTAGPNSFKFIVYGETDLYIDNLTITKVVNGATVTVVGGETGNFNDIANTNTSEIFTPKFYDEGDKEITTGLTTALSGKTVNVKAAVANYSNTKLDKTAQLIVCVYNGFELKDISKTSVFEVNADDTSVLSANITLPEFTEVGELTIQAFLWDSVSGMVPLCGATPLIAQ